MTRSAVADLARAGATIQLVRELSREYDVTTSPTSTGRKASPIGSAFGYRLSRAGHDVTMIARGARLEALRGEGAVVAVDGTRAPVRVAEAIAPSEPYDLLLVTVMAHHIEELLPSIASSRARAVLFMFKTFERLERWREAIGAERFEVGFPNMISFLVDGKVRHVVDGPGMATTLSSASWAKRLRDAGIPTEVEPDMESFLRSHAAFVRQRGELGAAEVRVLIDSMAAAGRGQTPTLLAIRP